MTTQDTGATVAGPPSAERALVWVLAPLLGAGVGWLLKALADWAASLAWIPFQGPFELVESAPDPQATVGALAVGALAGVGIAVLAERDYLVVTVADDEVTIAHGGSRQTVARSAVAEVFLDRKELVLLGPATEELARQGGDANAGRVEAAFRTHGYPWRDGGDPYRDEYRRWVEDLPDLPASANAYLKARARALEKGDREDAARLREELARMDVVVRDEKKRQYWRQAHRPDRPT